MMLRILILCLCFSFTAAGQQLFPAYDDSTSQDPQMLFEIAEVKVRHKRQWDNDTSRYNYNQMKYYVKIIQPLADNAIRLFNDIDDHSKTLSRSDKRKYIRSREKEIKREFDDQIRKLNKTQGKYLVMLINRELEMTCYKIVRELKSPVAATYYRTWAGANGIPLNKVYRAEDNPNFERIVKRLGY